MLEEGTAAICSSSCSPIVSSPLVCLSLIMNQEYEVVSRKQALPLSLSVLLSPFLAKNTKAHIHFCNFLALVLAVTIIYYILYITFRKARLKHVEALSSQAEVAIVRLKVSRPETPWTVSHWWTLVIPNTNDASHPCHVISFFHVIKSSNTKPSVNRNLSAKRGKTPPEIHRISPPRWSHWYCPICMLPSLIVKSVRIPICDA